MVFAVLSRVKVHVWQLYANFIASQTLYLNGFSWRGFRGRKLKGKELLLGTHNEAKYRRYQTILAQIAGVSVLSLRHLAIPTAIPEDGETAEENARKKAQGYALLTGLPTLSIDEALFIEGFSPEEQPGVNVRRYIGKAATDEELVTVFQNKLTSMASKPACATWTYALCLAFPSGELFLKQVSISTLFTNRLRLPLLPGYPLSSLQIDPASGKSLRDCTSEEEDRRLQPVYKAVKEIVSQALLVSESAG